MVAVQHLRHLPIPVIVLRKPQLIILCGFIQRQFVLAVSSLIGGKIRILLHLLFHRRLCHLLSLGQDSKQPLRTLLRGNHAVRLPLYQPDRNAGVLDGLQLLIRRRLAAPVACHIIGRTVYHGSRKQLRVSDEHSGGHVPSRGTPCHKNFPRIYLVLLHHFFDLIRSLFKKPVSLGVVPGIRRLESHHVGFAQNLLELIAGPGHAAPVAKDLSHIVPGLQKISLPVSVEPDYKLVSPLACIIELIIDPPVHKHGLKLGCLLILHRIVAGILRRVLLLKHSPVSRGQSDWLVLDNGVGQISRIISGT